MTEHDDRLILAIAIGRESVAAAVLEGELVFPLLVGGGDSVEAGAQIEAARRGDIGPLRSLIRSIVRNELEQGRIVTKLVIAAGTGLHLVARRLADDDVDGVRVTGPIDATAAASAAVAVEHAPLPRRVLVIDADVPCASIVQLDEDGLDLTRRIIGAGAFDASSTAVAIGAALDELDLEDLGSEVFLYGAFADAQEVSGPFTAAGWEPVVLRTTLVAEGACRLAAGDGPDLAPSFGSAPFTIGANAWNFVSEELDQPTIDAGLGSHEDQPTLGAGEPDRRRDLPTFDPSTPASDPACPGPSLRSMLAVFGAATAGRIPVPLAITAFVVVGIAGVLALLAFGGSDDAIPTATCTGSVDMVATDSDTSAPVPSATEPLDEIWSVDVGAPAAAAPVVLGDVIVVATLGTPDAGASVFGFDTGDGSQLWEAVVPGRVWSSPTVDHRAEPGLVWVADDVGTLVGLTTDGDELLRCQAPTAANSPIPFATPARDLVIFGTDGGVVRAIDASAGQQAWAFRIEAESDAGDPVRALAVVADRITALTSTGRVVFIDPEAGELLASGSLGADTAVAPIPTSAGDGVVVAGLDGTVARLGLDAAEMWSVDVGDGGVRAPIVTLGEWIWVGDSSGVLHQIDEANGDLIRSRRLGGPIDGGVTALARAVVTGDDSGTLTLLDAELTTVDQVALDGSVNGGLAVWEHGLVVMDSTGVLRRLDT